MRQANLNIKATPRRTLLKYGSVFFALAIGISSLVKMIYRDLLVSEVDLQKIEMIAEDKKVLKKALQYIGSFFRSYSQTFMDPHTGKAIGVVGYNPSPHQTVLEGEAIVAETSAYLLEQLLALGQIDKAFEMLKGIEGTQALKMYKAHSSLTNYGAFVDSLTKDGSSGVHRQEALGTDLNSAADADLKIVGLYIDLLNRLKSDTKTAKDIHKEKILYLENIIWFHLQAITHKDINIHHYKDKTFYVLKRSAGFEHREFNPSYVDFVMFDRTEKFLKQMIQNKAQVLGITTDLKTAKEKLLNLIKNENLSLAMNEALKPGGSDRFDEPVLHFEQRYQTAAREKIMHAVLNEMKDENSKTELVNAFQLVTYLEHAAAWEKLDRDTNLLYPKIIAARLRDQLLKKIQIADESDSARLTQWIKELDTPHAEMGNVFFEKYFGKASDQNRIELAALLKKMNIEDLTVTMAMVTFETGQALVSKIDNNDFQGGIEGKRFLINLSEKVMAGQGTNFDKNFLDLSARLAQKTDFVKHLDNFYHESGRSKVEQGIRFGHETLTLISGMAAAKASGDEKLFGHYLKQMNQFTEVYGDLFHGDFFKDFPNFLGKRMYFQRALLYKVLNLCFPEFFNAQIVKELQSGRQETYQANVPKTLENFLKLLPEGFLNFLGGKFGKNSYGFHTHKADEVSGVSAISLPNDQRLNAVLEEQTGGGLDGNLALTSAAMVIGRQGLISKVAQNKSNEIVREFFENMRAVRGLEAAMEQQGLKPLQQIEIAENLVSGRYERDYFIEQIAHVLQLTDHPTERQERFAKIASERAKDSRVAEPLVELFNTALKQNKSGSHLETIEYFKLHFPFDNSANTPLRAFLLDLYKSQGETYVGRLDSELTQVWASFESQIRDLTDKQFKSYHYQLDPEIKVVRDLIGRDPEKFPRHKYYLDLLQQDLWTVQEVFPEIDFRVSDSLAVLKILFKEDPLLKSLGNDIPAASPERVNQKVQQLKASMPKNEQGQAMIPSELRHRIYNLVAGLLEKQMANTPDMTQKLKIQDQLVKANLEALISLSDQQKIESDFYLTEVGEELLDRLIYSLSKKGDMLLESINSQNLLNARTREAEDQKLEQAYQIYLNVANNMKLVLNKGKGRLGAFKSFFSAFIFSGETQTSAGQIEKALGLIEGIYNRDFYRENFEIDWTYRLATLEFKFAQIAELRSDNAATEKHYQNILQTMQKLKLSTLPITGQKRSDIILYQSTQLETIARLKLAGTARRNDNIEKAYEHYNLAVNLGAWASGVDKTPSFNYVSLRVSPRKESIFSYSDIRTQKESSFRVINQSDHEMLEVMSKNNFGLTLELSRDRQPLDPFHPIFDLQKVREQKKGLKEKLTASQKENWQSDYSENKNYLYHLNRVHLIFPPDIKIKTLKIERSDQLTDFGLTERIGLAKGKIKITLETSQGNLSATFDENEARGIEAHRVVFSNGSTLIDKNIDEKIGNRLPFLNPLSTGLRRPDFKEYLPDVFFNETDLLARAREIKRNPSFETGETATLRQLMEKRLGTWAEFISTFNLWSDVDHLITDSKLKVFEGQTKILEETLRLAPNDRHLRLAYARSLSLLSEIVREKGSVEAIFVQSHMYAQMALQIYNQDLVTYLQSKPSAKIREYWEAKQTMHLAETLAIIPTPKISEATTQIHHVFQFLLTKSKLVQGKSLPDLKLKALALEAVYTYGRIALRSNNRAMIKNAITLFETLKHQETINTSAGTGIFNQFVEFLKMNNQSSDRINSPATIFEAHFEGADNRLQRVSDSLLKASGRD